MSAFRVEPAENGVVHLVMDDPARKVNVLDEAAIASLDQALAQLESLRPAGMVLRSGKPGAFIAGADVDAIGAMSDREQVRNLVRRAHATFARLGRLPCPTVAAIDGTCLGGGTELALACDSRIASDEPQTKIGFPEILLGIFPGFGGTTRLPRLVGLVAALDLILTGRALDARRAERIGLVARAAPGPWVLEHATRRLGEIAGRPPGHRRDRWQPRTLGARMLEGTAPGRALIISRARAMTKAKTGGHYPAPIAALRVLEHGLGRPLDEALAIEVESVSDLVVGPVCKNLVRIFQISERARKEPVVAAAAGAGAASAAGAAKPAPPRGVALVGAGVMGGGIAELTSRAGLPVRMRDVRPEAIAHALRTVKSIIDERRKRSRARRAEGDAQMARILPTLELGGVGRCDVAIEAVIEDMDVKRRVLAELEVRLPADAVIATNTSALPVGALADGLQRPERFCGLHFFNPVHRMPLVEVVHGPRTSADTLARAVALVRRLGKTPVVVKDAPGFVVNRILMPYLREAGYLLEEGYTVAAIDAAMRGFGMPMGPFEVADEVGLDVAAKVAATLAAAFPERMSVSPAVETLVAAGRLGRKSGAGFYLHRGGRRRPDPRLATLLRLKRERKPTSPEFLSERMVLAMVNEAALVLGEGVVTEAGMLDLAMVYGAGFPPFRGGPLRYADTLGVAKVESRLRALRGAKGERFAAAPRLVALADEGGSFTGLGPASLQAPSPVASGEPRASEDPPAASASG